MIRTRAQVGHNSRITRKSLADEIDTYDQSIADLNGSKKDCFDAYRDQLIAAGVAKENVRKEIEAVKAAIRRRRLVTKDAGAVEEKDALVDEIFAEISARPRAPRARVENIEQFGAESAKPDSLSVARTGANLENEDVDGSAAARTPAGEDSFALTGQIESQAKAENSIDRNASLAAREGEKSLHSNSPDDDGLDIPEFLRRPAH